jgi:hypothetical protein
VKAKEEEGQGWRRACEVEDMRDSCALALTSNWRGRCGGVASGGGAVSTTDSRQCRRGQSEVRGRRRARLEASAREVEDRRGGHTLTERPVT